MFPECLRYTFEAISVPFSVRVETILQDILASFIHSFSSPRKRAGSFSQPELSGASLYLLRGKGGTNGLVLGQVLELDPEGTGFDSGLDQELFVAVFWGLF